MWLQKGLSDLLLGDESVTSLQKGLRECVFSQDGLKGCMYRVNN